MKHEGWVEWAADLGVELTPDQAAGFTAYEALLRKRALPLGMVAKADAERLRERHVLDSLRAAVHVGTATSAYDLGSGAGLPGIPLALAVPTLEIVLVEARKARAAFLELAIEELGLPNVAVFVGRVESLTTRVGLVTARAFADAATSWRMAERLLEPGGRLVYFAGSGFDAAIEGPSDAVLRLFETPSLARSGPLAIMGRQ